MSGFPNVGRASCLSIVAQFPMPGNFRVFSQSKIPMFGSRAEDFAGGVKVG